MLKQLVKIMSAAAVVAATFAAAPAVHAEDTTTVTVSIQFSQSEARNGLAILNAFRKTNQSYEDYFLGYDLGRKYTSNLPDLQYDYELEDAAMHRAAEMAVYYSHTRPDGTSFNSGFPKRFLSYATGECSTWGNVSIEAVLENLEDEEHKANLLSESYNAFAMASSYVNGMHYWVMEFGYSTNIASTPTTAVDGAKDLSFTFKNSAVESYSGVPSALFNDYIYLDNVGATQMMPDSTIYMDLYLKDPGTIYHNYPKGNGLYNAKLQLGSWTSSNPNAATISNGTITATGKGRTVLSASALGRTFTCDVLCGVHGMYRLYNPNSGEHFYTGSVKEKNDVVNAGWNYEGVGWVAPTASSIPVYRLYNSIGGEHHYTMDASEKDMLVRAGWSYEGIGWYSDEAKTVPLYRQYNPNAFSCNHNYTTSKTENDYLASIGWREEGISWYGQY